MPTYEYVCDSCDHNFEVFLKMSDPPLSICPECGKEKLRQILSGGLGVNFRGTGFYVKDKSAPRKSALATPSPAKNCST